MTIALAIAMSHDDIACVQCIYGLLEFEHKEKKLTDAFKQNINNLYVGTDFICNVQESIMTFICDEIGYESFE